MHCHKFFCSVGIGLIGLTLTGCSDWLGGDVVDVEPELPTVSVHTNTEVATPVLPDPEPLKLSLEVGQYFPLKKSVDETLTQQLPQGETQSHRRLELLLSLTVEEKRDDFTRLGVKYHRVKFEREMDGERVAYDSVSTQGQIPWHLLAFQGLVDNGFSFWIGPDNRLTQLEKFDEFLVRCVQNVPEQHREAVMSSFIAVSGDEEIANFVDDSIGLLPFNIASKSSGSQVRIGDSWRRERQIVRPFPMYYNDEYTLERLDERAANIIVAGEIAPSTSFGPSAQTNAKLGVMVTGGRTTGQCLIDRNTGLPIQSEILRLIDMQVHLNDGSEFSQQKRVVTTVETFPHQNSGQPNQSQPNGLRTGNSPIAQGNGMPEQRPDQQRQVQQGEIQQAGGNDLRPSGRVVPASAIESNQPTQGNTQPRFRYAENGQ